MTSNIGAMRKKRATHLFIQMKCKLLSGKIVRGKQTEKKKKILHKKRDKEIFLCHVLVFMFHLITVNSSFDPSNKFCKVTRDASNVSLTYFLSILLFLIEINGIWFKSDAVEQLLILEQNFFFPVQFYYNNGFVKRKFTGALPVPLLCQTCV